MIERAAVVAAVLLLGSCNRGPQWMGFAYPDRNDLTEFRLVGYFDTLEQCREATLSRLDELSSRQRGDYECGYKCRPSGSGSDLHICEKTER